MATKPKKSTAPEAQKFPRKALAYNSGPSDDEKGRAYAQLVNSPELAAYRVIGMMQPKKLVDGIDTPTFLASLREQAAAAQDGDLKHVEAMLSGQASALQAMFVRLSERAMEQTLMPNLEGFMRLALRAQSQCRATLETLAVLKNPPVVYAKQANVTTGPQQVNNGVSLRPAQEIDTQQNQLFKVPHEQRLDIGTQEASGRIDSAVEALGTLNRPPHG